MIKNSLISFLILIFSLSCDDIPSDTIDSELVEYEIKNISAPKVVVFSETEIIELTVVIGNSETVNNVWFNLSNVNGTEEYTNQNIMTSIDEGSTKTYYGQYEIGPDFLPGKYEFTFYVEDRINVAGENVRKIGTSQFSFLLEEDNVPPILTNADVFDKTPQGSRITISVRVIDSNGPDDVDDVFFKISDPQDSLLYYDKDNGITEFPLLDDGENGDERKSDGIYSSYFTFEDDAQLGKWKIEIGARDLAGSMSGIIASEIDITENFPPEIGNLLIPSEIERGTEFIFSIEAADPNGLTDIYLVYFELYRPDGTVVYLDEENEITTFPMFDNGDTEGSGDEIENDGIYSLKNSFGESSQTGEWKFDFYAIDNSGTLSNTISFNLNVK